jgi:hypothetical protein
LFVLLAAVPASRAVRLLAAPASHHELNRVLDFAAENWKDGELLFLGRRPVKYSFLFARHRYAFASNRVLFMTDDPAYVGLTDPPLAERDVDRLRGTERVWIPLIYDELAVFQPYLAALDQHGKRLNEYHAHGATVFLYRFD